MNFYITFAGGTNNAQSTATNMEIEKDGLFSLAERYVTSTGMSVFLTGKAGTGKTTFLKYITDNCSKRHVVLAPTGVAAINAGGSTIHSFFHLPLCPYLPDVHELITEYQVSKGRSTLNKERISLIRSLDLIIIDEISMVRADLLDAVDMTLRRYRHSSRPFGGVQLLLIGDAQQLSPVVKEDEAAYMQQVYPSPYFFESKAFRKLRIVTIELRKVYRQKDIAFVNLLNAIRENNISDDVLTTLNTRVGKPCAGVNANVSEPIRLTTHNRQATDYNIGKLASLPTKPTVFTASVNGDFPESSYPVEAEIRLKRGAQVMFTRNDPGGRYYNGKIVQVTEIDETMILVRDEDGEEINVEPVTWENVHYKMDDDTGEIIQETVGTFTQIPLRLAWAITIHKSQGLTFDNVIIDAGAAFAFGQVYVALSRCRSLEGISLESPIRAHTIYSDTAVVNFNASQPTEEYVREKLPDEVSRFNEEKMESVFDFNDTVHHLELLSDLWSTHLKKIYPLQHSCLEEMLQTAHSALDVAERFKRQISRLAANGQKAVLDERMKKAAAYFEPIVTNVFGFCQSVSSLEIDNKDVKKRVRTVLEGLYPDSDIHCCLMRHIKENGFDTESCEKLRTACLLGEKTSKTSKPEKKLNNDKASKKEGESDFDKDDFAEINEILKNRLIAWRTARCKADNVPAYVIMHQTTLMQIAAKAPRDEASLLSIKGFGKIKTEKYGAEIIEICRSVMDF